MRKIVLLSFLLFSLNLSAQVEWSGILDAGFTMGGKESNTITNGISDKYPNFNIQSLSLFLFSQLNDDFSFNGKLLYYPRLYGIQSPARIVMANVSWDPQGESFGFSAGKILTPFGLYPKKQHSSDNISFLPPLAYSYFVNIASKNEGHPGYWPLAGEVGSYGANEVGSTTIFESGYQTGIKGYFVYDEWIDIEIALTNSPASNPAEIKSNNAISTQGRIGFKPAIWYNLGISFNYGSYMDETPALENESKYKQLTIGIDQSFAYSYFEISGEYIFNKWNAPKFAGGFYDYDKVTKEVMNFELYSHMFYTDIKIDIPFFPGLFLGTRLERILFPEFTNPNSLKGKERWDSDIDRITGVLGYRASKEVILKAIGFIQKTKSVAVDPKDDGLALQVSVSF